MATIAYLKIESVNRGCLSSGCNTPASMGNGFQENHEDEITVLSYSHNVAWDNRSIHSPVQIIKKIDKSSPVLAQACSDGDELMCTLTFYRHAPNGGAQEAFYEVTLIGALIRNIRSDMPHVVSSGELEMQENISISYRDIQWKHLAATTSAFSSWLKVKDMARG
ncbi:type VI secretion system tube protein TssD [Vibrio tasmaniensis 1F-187]|uniref:Secreted protein Hcp n=1 Tax=Vibrio tasmaniensis TaxID=212663 RepID=A0A0H3ZZ78_9VIBR|nr:Secreted protein Hcp [Vibrio tasmaniensis]